MVVTNGVNDDSPCISVMMMVAALIMTIVMMMVIGIDRNCNGGSGDD
jgi:hypothetical protein